MFQSALTFHSDVTQEQEMTKKEIESAVKEVNQQIVALEAKHPGQEMRPWDCNDHPVALEHWKLLQRRISLKYEKSSPTVEQRLASAQRLRHRAISRPVSHAGIDDQRINEVGDIKTQMTI
jgi:hypothetical protein